jgi:predicted nucleic acid-binding Zn ribbon protein
VTTLPLPMHTSSRIQQIIDHERAIYRSLTPFGFAIALLLITVVVLALR